ncbi:uncharacterized protein TNCV_2035341 [Trichonephila clavipes]|nr:uncharacterized protein TNCV_2035341 [Trichonephila clavipes]
MKNITATFTIHHLRILFAHCGIPLTLVSDNGASFTSYEFQHFLKLNNIKHLTSAPYHPATNGQAERIVQLFKASLKSSRDEPVSDDVAETEPPTPVPEVVPKPKDVYLYMPLQVMIYHLSLYQTLPESRKLMCHSDAQTESGDLQRDSTCDSIFCRGGTVMYLATARSENLPSSLSTRADFKKMEVGETFGTGLPAPSEGPPRLIFAQKERVFEVTPRYLVLLDQGTCVLCKYNFGGSFLMWCEKKTASVFATFKAIFQVENQSSSLAICLCKKKTAPVDFRSRNPVFMYSTTRRSWCDVESPAPEAVLLGN